MKNDLTCGVVRDLLPSYVEGLLGEESLEAVERHLEGCPECAARKAAMFVPAEAAEETAREVDFLKRVRKWNVRWVALAAVCTAAVLLGAAVLKLFVIGTPLQPQSVTIINAEILDEGATLSLSLWSAGSGNAFHSWKLETEDGVTSIRARDVLVSPLNSSGQALIRVPLKDIREVWLGGTSGRLVWQDGMLISPECLDLLDLRTPYCGDAPALGRITQELGLQERLGGYSTELHTSQPPYGCTLVFDNPLANDSQWTYLSRCAILMRALVDNLDYVQVQNGPDAPGETLDFDHRALEMLTEAYNHDHGTDWTAKTVKEYARTPADFQRLLAVTDYFWLDLGGVWITSFQGETEGP